MNVESSKVFGVAQRRDLVEPLSKVFSIEMAVIVDNVFPALCSKRRFHGIELVVSHQDINIRRDSTLGPGEAMGAVGRPLEKHCGYVETSEDVSSISKLQG